MASLLPSSLGVFIRSTQAKLFGQVMPATSSASSDASAAMDQRDFGIGAVYNSDTGTLEVSLAELAGRILFGSANCVQAVVGIYKVLDISSDYLLESVVVTPEMLKQQPPTAAGKQSQLKMWSLRFALDSSTVTESELVVSVTITRIIGAVVVDSVTTQMTDTVSAACPVSVLEPTSTTHKYIERYRPQVDASDPHEERDALHEIEFEEDPDAEAIVFDIDFTREDDNIVVAGTASVAYTGGGNRLLPMQDRGIDSGDFVTQEQNQSPWSSGTRCICESSSRNGIADTQQVLGRYRFGPERKPTGSNSPSLTTTTQQFDVDAFPGYRAQSFAVAGSLSINNVWLYESEAAPLSAFTGPVTGADAVNVLVGSALIQAGVANTSAVSGGNRNKLSISIGVHVLDNTGAKLAEAYTDYGALERFSGFDVGFHDTGSLASEIVTSYPTAAFVALVIRVTGICPGDRFTVTVLAPQIEDSGTAGTRFIGTGHRVADTITLVSEAITSFDSPYGMFTWTGTPSYGTRPANRDSMFFDSRQSLTGSGFYCYHSSASGSFVFGVVDADLNIIEAVTGPHDIVIGQPLTLQLAFDATRIRGTVSQPDTETVTATKTATAAGAIDGIVVPDIPRLRVGSSEAVTFAHYDGEINRFALELRSLSVEQATTESDILSTASSWE